jgi:hypothetical protein
MARVNVEHAIQVALFNQFWIRRTAGALLFAIPLGGARDKITAKMLKDEGVTAGVPDMWGRAMGRPGFWLELKRRKGGVVSDAQEEMHAALSALGERVFVAKGLDAALGVLVDEGVIV